MDLEAIRKRCEAATEGPWKWRAYAFGFRVWDANDNPVCDSFIFDDIGSGIIKDKGIAPFIAHARTDIPALLDEVERLRAEVDGFNAVHRDTGDDVARFYE